MIFSDHKINWRLYMCTALFFIGHRLFSQQPYFQQRVDYIIDVKLNDTAHTLSAFEKIKYVNHSQQSLDFIYFHLWPNAYKNNTTALSKQLLLQEDKSALFFSKPEERGFIDSLNFKVNGKTIRWEYDPQHIDICKLILNEPLKSSDSLIITTPFFVKIPSAEFSRLGHTGQAYFITQWYPKPAVFDNTGWHQMPYLDQGEFYSEFGSFDVSITLPENYLLAATGDRVNANEEEKFLDDKVEETRKRLLEQDFRRVDMRFPPSSTKLKTIRFKQHQVHDFAWFADKRYNVLRGQVQLPESEHKVDTWIFFSNKNFELWSNVLTYVNEATLFYSVLNGNYPYNHVTAVDGTIMAGGGMEYPNITVIGDVTSGFELDITITHEVGHNWFYGILGSDERDHPFMDEGINSFYELRYIRAKYPEKKLVEYLGRDTTFRLFRLNKIPVWKTNEVAFFSALKAHSDQAIDLPSADYTVENYGSVVYSKTALAFDYLMDYMGANTFDKAMKLYFETYKFKHSSPTNLLNTLSESSGMNLDAFNKYFLNSTDRIDYKIKHVKQKPDSSYAITIKNKTGAALPSNIYAYKNNNVVAALWFEGFKGTQTLTFTGKDIDRFKIDGLNRLPDINRRNNTIKTKGLFKRSKPLQFNLVTAMQDPDKTQINYLPIVGANFYNGFMLGASIHNYSFYQKRFEYAISPMYGFRSKTLTGFAEFNYNFYPKKVFQQIVLGTKVKSFAYDYINNYYLNQSLGTNYRNQDLNYYKIAPYIQFEIKKKVATSPIQQFITYSNTNLFTDSLDVSSLETIAIKAPQKKNVYSFVNQLSYSLMNNRGVDPFSLFINLQHTASMAKISATYNYKIMLSKKYYFDVRAFAGAFIAGNLQERSYYAFRASGYQGYQDYLFDGNFTARNEFSGFGFSQFMDRDGALKVYTPLGQSAQWLASLNVKSPQLFFLPVKLFADAVACDARSLLTDKFLWDAGINITLLKDIIDVYIPLAYNTDIKQTLQLNNINFAHRIRFTFNIHKLEPKTILQNSFF